MPVKRFLSVVRMFAALMVLFLAMQQAGVAEDASTSGVVGYEDAVVSYLRPVLGDVGGAARIYYAGECRAAEYDTSGNLQLRFPAVTLRAASTGSAGMNAVRQIFRDDPNVSVAQDRSGMVRITIGVVSDAVLRMKIASLTLAPDAQYTPLSAIDEIAIAADTYAKKGGLPFRLGPYVIDHLVSGPVEGAPHLPAMIQNITIDEALDAVARTFKGIVIYGLCVQPNGKGLFRPGFIYGSKPYHARETASP